MRFSITLKLVLIFISVILIPVSVITFVSMWINVGRLEKELQNNSAKALHNARAILQEHVQNAENISALLSGTSEIRDNLSLVETEPESIQFVLDDKQEMWFTAIVEIFGAEKNLIARSYARGAALEPFFTRSDDPILLASLDNLEKQSDYFVSPGGLAIKAAMPVVNFETLETLGAVIVTYPFNVHLLQVIKERVNAEVTVLGPSNCKTVTTLRDQKGAAISQPWETAVSFSDKRIAEVIRGRPLQQQERIGSSFYATNYTSLMNREDQAVGILATAVDSTVIDQSKADTLRLILASSLGIFLLAITVGYLTARYFTRPIHKLVRAIRSMAQGNLEERVHLRQNDEIGDLATAFNEMTEELQEKQEALKKAEEKYRGIFENAVEGIFQSTRDGCLISANPAQARILGYDSVDDLLALVTNTSEQLYVNPEDREIFRNTLDEQGKIFGFETRFYRKDGIWIWVSVSAHAVRDEEGNLLYYEGSLTDITERLEKEKAEREREVAEAANKKIMESIRYAEMIQRSLLPSEEEVMAYLPDSFTIWKPRDLVGGDIVFSDFFEDEILHAVIDCTGHGVPGAFMTMIASSGIRKIIKDEGCRDPAEILKQLNFFVKTSLQQDTGHALSDDGLDAAICRIRIREKVITFAGAKQSLICVEGNTVHTIKGDRQSIGYKRSDLDFSFSNHDIPIKKGMAFYMFSDGFVDQFGWEDHRRFGTKRFRELLEENAHLPFEQQRDLLLRAFEDHKGENEIQDDVTVVGFGFREIK